MLFQTGFSGRAEFGLAGNDDWSVKVSPNGSVWQDAIVVDKDNGGVSLLSAGLTLDTSLFPNLLPDSGRFNGNANQYLLVSAAAVAPGYIGPHNSATLTYPAKFIHNNTTYSGSAGTLYPVIDELIVKIFGGGGKRYGTEFWYMNIIAGAGTASPVIVNGDTYYLATIVSQAPRPARYTSGMFLRCSVGKALLPAPFSGIINKFTRDGAAATFGTTDAVVVPADGWVYFEATHTRGSLSYDLTDIAVRLMAGSTAQIALPRVLPGWVDIGFADKAVVAAGNVFP